MIVIHIESGLGNQMLSYCEFIAAKHMNPRTSIYVETIIYEIPECQEYISQWNGYELESVFYIHAPNIKDLFSIDEWKEIIDEVKGSRFWEQNWNYSEPILNSLSRHGVVLENKRKKYDTFQGNNPSLYDSVKRHFFDSRVGYTMRHMIGHAFETAVLHNKQYYDDLFIAGDNYFSGQKLDFNKKNSGIEKIEEEVIRTFVFSNVLNEQNTHMRTLIIQSESIGIHIRRGDMLSRSNKYFRNGYYKKAIKYIKMKVNNPVFYVFGDADGITWAVESKKKIGIDDTDVAFFIDWNTGANSYVDMYLMSLCKHQIITNSSFGWWAAYLNNNPTKITISPEYILNTTHWI